MMILTMIGAVVFSMILFLLRHYIISKYSAQSKLFTDYFYYIFPLSFFLSFVNVFVAYSYSIFRTSVPTLINDILVRIGSIILFTMFFLKWLTLSQFIFLYVGIYGGQFLILLVYLLVEDNISFKIDREHLSKQDVRGMYKYGMLMSVAALSALGLKYLDSVMLGLYQPKQAGLNALDVIGIYSIAAFVATIVETPINALDKIIVGNISDSWAKNNMANIQDVYFKSSKYLFLIGGILFTLVNLNLDSLFALMPDKDFSLGKNVVLIISLGTLINMATGCNDAILTTSSRYKYILYLLIALFIVALINYMIFIPLFGMIGAAVATTFSTLLYNVSKFALIRRFFHLQPFSLFTLKILGVILITFIGCSFIPAIVNPYVTIAIRSAAIVLCYGTLTLALNIVPEFYYLVPFLKNRK
jgi:O-antigen/teichoic acid export membrane protein